ncbi:MAG: site-specific DNA-methyltransferase [Clostridia bacterium]|nr:site-specific DNA-methyltransferase [Clostridia bacterium]
MENINDYMPLSNDWNKERLETLKKMFPDLFTNERNLNINELKKVIDPESVSETERYEFRWFGKSAAKRNAFSPSNATLVYDEARSVNPTETENLIIEGENLEVLKLLSTAYREKVKCIYIDPPYNTGNDFVYSDNFSQDKKAYWEDSGVIEEGVRIDSNTETDGRYHSNWLNMMYSRLLIARQLLKEDGVVFISIDDNEMHHLRKLCDEVFGEECFIAVFPWKKRTAKSDVPFGVSQDYEWIVAYAKDVFNAGLSIERKYYETDDYPNDKWRLSDLTTQKVEADRPNSAFDLIDPKTQKVYPYNPNRLWGITKDTFKDYYDKGKIVFPDDYNFLNITIPAYRVFESEDKAKAFEKYGSEEAIKAASTFLPKEIGMNEDGNKEIIELFGSKIFSYPKPTPLIKHLINIANSKDALVLDFFSGSGSTGQAIMELNNEDGGCRKYILVQIPETIDEKSEAYKAGYKKISDITIERNKRVIEKIIEEKKTQQPDLFANDNEDESLKNLGFKVFKLVKSNFPRVEFAPIPDKTTEENIDLLKKYIKDKEAQLITPINRDNLITEILLKNGFNLNYKVKPFHEIKGVREGLSGSYIQKIEFVSDDEKETLICLDEFMLIDTVEYFKQNTDKKFICLERALDTTKKWNLKHYLGDKFNAF